MKEILENNKLFYTIVGLALLIPIMIGILYVFTTIYS